MSLSHTRSDAQAASGACVFQHRQTMGQTHHTSYGQGGPRRDCIQHGSTSANPTGVSETQTRSKADEIHDREKHPRLGTLVQRQSAAQTTDVAQAEARSKKGAVETGTTILADDGTTAARRSY
jgi:hypothetical protein